MRSAVRESQTRLHSVGALDRHLSVAVRAALGDIARQQARLLEADGTPSTVHLHFAGLISGRRHVWVASVNEVDFRGGIGAAIG